MIAVESTVALHFGLLLLCCSLTATSANTVSEAEKDVVVITGASSGIGRAVAKELAATWVVVVAARRKEKLNSLVEEIQSNGGEAIAISCDTTSQEQVDALFLQIEEQYGNRLIGAFLNAGLESPMAPLPEIPITEVLKTINVNVVGTTLTYHRALKYWKKNNVPGRVVVSSSIAAVMGRGVGAFVPSSWSVYSATKSYIDGLIRTSSGLEGETGVKAYSLNIAAFTTPMLERAADSLQLPDPSASSGFNPVFKATVGDSKDIAPVVAAMFDNSTTYPAFSCVTVDNSATFSTQLLLDGLETTGAWKEISEDELRGPDGGEYKGPSPKPPSKEEL